MKNHTRHFSLLFLVVLLLRFNDPVSSAITFQGTFLQQTLLSASSLDLEGRFGSYLAMNDRFLVAGVSPEPGTCPYGHNNLIIYEKSSQGWQMFLTLSAAELPQNRLFTGPISMAENFFAVGGRDMDHQRSVVIIYLWDGKTWLYESEIIMPDLPEDCSFDGSVVMEGGRLVVGMRTATVDGIRYKGAVYIFTWDGSSWIIEQKLVYEGDFPYTNYFGYAVALNGDELFVGVPYGGGFYRGEVDVYRFKEGTWAMVQTVMASDGGDYFGYALDVCGDSLLIGAPLDFETYFEQGSAYIFEKTIDTWTQSAKLVFPDGEMGDHFGAVVAVDLDTVAIGAINYGKAGSVFVYRKPESGWIGGFHAPQKLPPEYLSLFGSSLSIRGNSLAVGSPDEYIGNEPGRGAVHIFYRGIRLQFPEELIEGEPEQDLMISLDSKPIFPVTISFSRDEQLTFSQETITFSESDWNQPQIIGVAAESDCYINDDRLVWIVPQSISDDINYNQLVFTPQRIKILEKIRFQYSEFRLEDGKKQEILFALSQPPAYPVILSAQENSYLSIRPESITIYPDGSRSEDFFEVFLRGNIEQTTSTTLILESQSEDSFYSGGRYCLRFEIEPFTFERIYLPVVNHAIK